MKGKLLLIEDDQDLGQEVKNYLNAAGFTTQLVPSSFGAIEYCKSDDYDLLLVDIHLPGKDGFELVESIRKIKPHLHFLFLTARNQKMSRLKGLKLGAEDYITKPFDIEELAWRIHNILNRQERSVRNESEVCDIYLSYKTMELVVAENKKFKLTAREFELWKYLLEHVGQVLKREDILMSVWGDNDYFLGRSLDVFISRIRKILQYSQLLSLETVFKVGFILKQKT